MPYFKRDVFRFYSVGKSQGWKILVEDNKLADRTYRDSLLTLEKRGRLALLSPEQIHYIDKKPSERYYIECI